METSAKANINIEEAFSELAEAILEKTSGREALDAGDRACKLTADKRGSEKAPNRCC
jgi:Ras-related protein Rab-10